MNTRPGSGRHAARGGLLAAVTTLLLALLTALPLAVPAGLAASAPTAQPGPAPAGRLTYGVQPARDGQPDSTRASYSYSATPGARISDEIAIRNYGDSALDLRVYPADAFNDDTGGFDVNPSAKRSVDLGAWVRLASGSVRVPPRSAVTIPFQVALPMNAEPGDHAAGIVAALRTQQLRSNGTSVSVENRVGARIYLRVSGPLRPQLSVSDFRPVYHGTLDPIGSGGAEISYTVRNTGNVRLSAAQALTVKPWFLPAEQANGLPRIPELLPGNSSKQVVHLSSVPPMLRDSAAVTLRPSSASGDVPGLEPVTTREAFWAIPWTLLGLVLLVAVLIALWLLRRRRRTGATGAARTPDPRGPADDAPLTDLLDGESEDEPLVVDVRDRPVDLRDPVSTRPAGTVVDVREPRASERPVPGRPSSDRISPADPTDPDRPVVARPSDGRREAEGS